MNALSFVASLTEKGVQLSVREGKVKFKARHGLLTTEEKKTLKNRKQEIIAILGPDASPTTRLKARGLKPIWEEPGWEHFDQLQQTLRSANDYYIGGTREYMRERQPAIFRTTEQAFDDLNNLSCSKEDYFWILHKWHNLMFQQRVIFQQELERRKRGKTLPKDKAVAWGVA